MAYHITNPSQPSVEDCDRNPALQRTFQDSKVCQRCVAPQSLGRTGKPELRFRNYHKPLKGAHK